jgi:hypothetical protein
MFVTTLEDSRSFAFRFLRQQLLPESPGGDQRAAESCAYARWFQRRLLPSSVGDKARTVGSIRLRGCVSDLPL